MVTFAVLLRQYRSQSCCFRVWTNNFQMKKSFSLTVGSSSVASVASIHSSITKNEKNRNLSEQIYSWDVTNSWGEKKISTISTILHMYSFYETYYCCISIFLFEKLHSITIFVRNGIVKCNINRYFQFFSLKFFFFIYITFF